MDLDRCEHVIAGERCEREAAYIISELGGISVCRVCGNDREAVIQERQHALEAKSAPAYAAFGEHIALVDSIFQASQPTVIECESCGVEYGVGCSPWCRDGHARVTPRGGFEPRFDIGLGREVTGWGDVKQEMRRKKLDYREHPSNGDLSARKDRIEQQKRGR